MLLTLYKILAMPIINISSIISSIIFLLGTITLGFFATQADFSIIFSGYLMMFAAYAWWLFRPAAFDWKTIVFVAVFARLILAFALPSLSDDYFRFIWDGLLTNAGYNPFNFLPSEIVNANMPIAGLTPSLYESMNSPNYYTVYPPVLQAVFALSTFVFGDNVYAATVLMKLLVLSAECGSAFLIVSLLKHFQQPLNRVVWYVANPLVVIEITGNLHFEGIAVFFFLLGWWLIVKQYFYASAVAIALSIATKLLPLMFLPFFIKRLGWKRAILYFAIIGAVLIAVFSPLLNEVFINNFRSSLGLYFAHFEYNASVFYALQWVGRQLSNGHNWINILGPALGAWTALTIFGKAWVEDRPDWQNFGGAALFAFTLFLLTTTTVHPWYLSFLIVLSAFSNFKFPLVWAFFAVLTYINYSYNPYHENKWIVAVEYIVVLSILAWELRLYLKANKNVVEENN